MLQSFYAARARNPELLDVEGRRYVDFASGIAVLNNGHCHPRVEAALREQLEHFHHTAHQVVPYASDVTLAERLNSLASGQSFKKTAFFTPSAEAVENARHDRSRRHRPQRLHRLRRQFPGLRRIADEHGLLLIGVDHIQTGLARTGRWFACYHHDVPIDLIWSEGSRTTPSPATSTANG